MNILRVVVAAPFAVAAVVAQLASDVFMALALLLSGDN